MLYSAEQLTYLTHLGIDVWVPKDLPMVDTELNTVEPVPMAAAASAEPSYTAPNHFEDVPAVTQTVSHTAQVTQPQTAPVANPSVSVPTASVPLASGTLNSAVSSGIPAPAFPKQNQVDTTVTVSRVEFNIQFWCYSSGVWFIGGDVNVTPEQHKLVHNLAQFIQGKKRRPRHVNVFSWPMIDSPNVDQGEDIAIKYLSAHIERLQQACEQKIVIVFNDCDYFPSQIPHVKLEMSLQQLLNEPAAKKILWQQLLPLKFQD